MKQDHGDPDSKVHGANMGPIWGRQDPDGPHVGPMNFAIWGTMKETLAVSEVSYSYTGLILGLHTTNERWCYFVTTSLIGWAQS